MKANGLNQYLDEIGHTPLLTEEQERQLAARIHKGDERAMNRLVEANLRLVVATARQYQGQGMDMDDLVSEGNIGLMKAAAKYNPEGRTTRFASYAVPVIKRQIEKLTKQTHPQPLPIGRGVNTSIGNKDVQGNYSPPSQGGAGGGSAGSGSAGAARSAVSLDAPLGIKPNLSLLAVLADNSLPPTDSRLYSGAQLEAIERALDCLDERERRVITAYFGIGQEYATMAEIATDMGLKRERVRQIRNRAVRRMKHFLRNTVMK